MRGIADLDRDVIPGLLEIDRQIFIPRSVMETGTRSATAEVLPVSAEAGTQETLPVRTSRRATVERRAAGGILLARREAHPQRRFAEELVSVARPFPDRVSEAPHSDRFRTRASDRTHNLAARVSIPLAASADLAIEDLDNGRFGAGFGWRGNSFGGFNRFSYGRGRGFWPGYGWGGGFFASGFGWGFGSGWPYWGSYWGLGWNPWLYDPYWYAPWPSYYYRAYPDIGYVNPAPYDPAYDPGYDYDTTASYLIMPRFHPAALRFNVTFGGY